MSAKILFMLWIVLAFTNGLYFQLKNGESKWFNYDLTKKAVYVGEYKLLDEIPSLKATGDGVRVNFHEPNPGTTSGKNNYYTKIFQNTDRQVRFTNLFHRFSM